MTNRANVPGDATDPSVEAVVAQALALIGDGARVGLGTGRAAEAFIEALGARVRQGLRVSAVPTSRTSARQAREVGVPLIDLDEDVMLDLIVDGADEVAPNLDLVKGWGGALVQERIVASASKRQIILVGQEKLVARIGERGRIPIEVIPMARGPITRRLEALGLEAAVRTDADGTRPLLTENGNLTLDCAVTEPLGDGRAARALETALLAIVGVVDTGLFLGTAERVLVGYPDGRVETLGRRGPEMGTTTRANIEVSSTCAALMHRAARRCVAAADAAIHASGRFIVALSGGSTPQPLYAWLATEPYLSRAEWSRVHWSWGEERCVPPGARFDFGLLGMGGDGHRASLFPGSAAVREQNRWVMAEYVRAVSMWRVTLTPVLINAAAAAELSGR